MLLSEPRMKTTLWTPSQSPQPFDDPRLGLHVKVRDEYRWIDKSRHATTRPHEPILHAKLQTHTARHFATSLRCRHKERYRCRGPPIERVRRE